MIGGVQGDPVLSFATTSTDGTALHAVAYSGACRVEKQRGGGRGPFWLGFYVPDAGPFRASHLLTSWADVSLAMTQVAGGDYAQRGPYGVDGVTVQLVDDGSGRQWPFVWMRVWGGEPMLLRYRLMVTQPLDR
jgi:hypothetical protein